MSTIVRVKEDYGREVAQAVENTMSGPILRGRDVSRNLVMAIIAQAYIDALRGDPIALAYFNTYWYRCHLAWCQLPLWWLPEGLERAPYRSDL